MPVNQIIQSMQELFIHQSRALARSSGFCQRTSRLSASAWVQGLVFGWLSNPHASVSSLARTIAVAGAPVSPQAVQQRFGEAGANLLRGVLESLTPSALQQATQAELKGQERDWLKVFPALWLRDSTCITLPLALQRQWPGTGGLTGPSAAVKVSVQWEWHSGTLAPLHLAPAKEHDQKLAREQDALASQNGHCAVSGEMHVFDLGYFNLQWLSQLHAQNAYFCCRYKTGTGLQPTGPSTSPPTSPPLESWLDSASLIEWLKALPATQMQGEWEMKMGHHSQLPIRLLAVRVPSQVATVRRQESVKRHQRKRQTVSQERLDLLDWNLYVTNAPASLLSLEQAQVLYRLRWQIERLFRLWKETLALDCWRTQNPQRILCEIYAKLIGALLTQKLTAFCLWHDPACSLLKCAQTIAAHALALLIHLNGGSALQTTLLALQRACRAAARLEHRVKKPATFQRLQMAN